MVTNDILEAKYRAQRALSEQSGDDLAAYAKNTQRIVREIEREHGLKFRYRRSRPARRRARSQPRIDEGNSD